MAAGEAGAPPSPTQSLCLFELTAALRPPPAPACARAPAALLRALGSCFLLSYVPCSPHFCLLSFSPFFCTAFCFWISSSIGSAHIRCSINGCWIRRECSAWGEDLRQIQPGPAGIRGETGALRFRPAQPLNAVACLSSEDGVGWGSRIRSSVDQFPFPGRKLGINHNGVATYLV